MNSKAGPSAAATQLDAAVAAAVAEGLEIVERLSDQVVSVLDRCLEAGRDAGTEHGERPGRDVIAAFTGLLTDQKAEADGRFTRQRSRLATFNLVLFGRTGAGKSSLIEALSSGNGEPISQGESDWTTDVRDVFWRSTRLVDTPGIGGWGRTVARADLEARAEAAVADADVVILCFDTQSQQAGEFSKIAEWVSRYGKPVVAVLNSRNPRWRNPTKVGSQSSRQGLSQSVHEHMGNIGDELGLVGLPDVPVVAIHTKRAAFARTSDPYAGPDADSREKQRDEHGTDRLLAWSNLPALELLLSEAVSRNAAALRLGMLHEQARGLLAEAESAVRTEQREAVLIAEQLERGIADVLQLVGRPADRGFAKDLRRLEKLRGGFGIAGPSELLRHARHRVSAGLRNVRMEALGTADRVVEAAFEANEDLDAADFDKDVLLSARTDAEKVARTIGGELQHYLLQRLELVADDVRADLSATVGTFQGTDATAGRTARTIGIALESTSGLLSMGSGGVLLVAALTAWNPAGWILATVAIGSAVGGIVVSFVGARVRKKGAADRVSALSDARSRARRAVNETFDDFERSISQDLDRILSEAAHERLADDVAQALALRRVVRAADAASLELQTAVERLPRVADASQLLAEAATDLQRRHHPGEPTAQRLLWLGESWCTDPEGLIEQGAIAHAPPIVQDPARGRELIARVSTVTEAAALVPTPGAGAAWASAARNDLADDPEALAVLAPFVTLANTSRPRIVVAGDYSTGKSSFIKRLLVDLGLGVPEQLEVAAQPKTSTAAVFRWGFWELIDTPGFQSTHAEHGDIAVEAVVGASVLVVLFNPNLVVGAASDLAAVLMGNGAGVQVGKLSRTLFVINRSDELGIDPREDPTGYQNLCRRKELELAQAVGALLHRTSDEPLEVRADQMLCVAGDPYGLVGDRTGITRADYDQHRDWDGMEALVRGFSDASVALGRNGADIRILEGSAAALGELVATRCASLSTLGEAIVQRQRLLLDLDACLSAGRALQAAARDRLVNGCVGFVAQLFDDITGADHSKDVLAAKVEELENWANHSEMQELYREWATKFARDHEAWQEATTARIDARIESIAFVSAFTDRGAELDVDHLAPAQAPIVQGAAKQGAKELAKASAKASRESVTKVAHAFGVKFKPWGATKLTAKVNTVGGVLGVGVGAFELYGIWRSTQKDGELEQTAHERRAASLRQVRGAAERFFDSTDPDGPSLLMTQAIEKVQRFRDDVENELEQSRSQMATLRRQIDGCEAQLRLALERLEAHS